MTQGRREYKRAEELALLAEVGTLCPLCGKKLFRNRKGREYKQYELAHIYPLNPTAFEVVELEGVDLLSSDPNHPANIIPLCRGCHGDFDKPRTREGYERLAEIKRRAARRLISRELDTLYPLEPDFSAVVRGLGELGAEGAEADLSYTPRKVRDKLTDSAPRTLRRKVENNVQDYFATIRSELKELEGDSPSSSELICSQVRTYYLAQAKRDIGEAEVFENVVTWIRGKVAGASLEEAEAVASYFVQNCEVFD